MKLESYLITYVVVVVAPRPQSNSNSGLVTPVTLAGLIMDLGLGLDNILNISIKIFSTFSILKSESLAIADLGAAIYDALDYSLETDQQRTLSGSLENLIEKMTSADEENSDENEDDEGIDDDVMIKLTGQCSMVLDLCR